MSRRGSIAAALASVTLIASVAVSGRALASGHGGGSGHDHPHDLFERLQEGRSLDGSGNNLVRPTLGQAGTPYARVARATYADDIGSPIDGPDPRYVSNRLFNDGSQNVFSERGVSQWGFVWGQFLDHTFGLRLESDESVAIPFDPTDPLEEFRNDLGFIPFTRSAAAEGSGQSKTREQVNTVSSYIDASAIYGDTAERLDWLRVGPVDGDPNNNMATLLTAGGYLPTADARPGVDPPAMDAVGRLMGDPDAAVIAGDVRANENIALTATHTLFVREHNRIVAALPAELPDDIKFAIARRIVGAEQQWITYNEFLPAMGVMLASYEGYDASVDPSITNEFATVGYRAHSQIHGELETEVPLDAVADDEEELAALEQEGVEVTVVDGTAQIAVPLNVAFGNPELLRRLGLGNVLAGLGHEAQYSNDEMIDNQLRSVLFQGPGPDVDNPEDCLDGPALPGCFSAVIDLGAIDIARGRDHGMPTYNEMRVAFGLRPASSFAELTGESTEDFPADPALDVEDTVNDPDILDFVALVDRDGHEVEPGSEEADEGTVTATRRTTVASRLKAMYGSVDRVDAFVGMVAEPHVEGTEFGELQLAMWTAQFTALRDGDRFFYGNDPVLREIRHAFGIDFRRSLAQVIVDNTDLEAGDVAADVFAAPTDGDVADQPGVPHETDVRPEACSGQRTASRPLHAGRS